MKRIIPSLPALAAGPLFAGIFGLSSVASATTTVSEPFAYSSGNFAAGTAVTGTGITGGTGLWTGTGTATILVPSLSNNATLAPSTGGSLSLDGSVASANRGALLNTTVSSGTLWFSFLMASTVDTARTLDFGLTATGTGIQTPTIGKSNSAGNPGAGVFELNFNGFGAIATPITMTLNTTYMIIGRVEFDAQVSATVPDRVSMWVVPGNGEIDPNVPYSSNFGNIGTVTGINMRALGPQGTPPTVNGAQGTFDEIRFGDDLESVATVTAVPEPASTAFAFLGGLSLLCVRRRAGRN
jgi:hypothetical protein